MISNVLQVTTQRANISSICVWPKKKQQYTICWKLKKLTFLPSSTNGKDLCLYLHVNKEETWKSTFIYFQYKKSCLKASSCISIQLAEINPFQHKYAVRFEGEECAFNLESSCEGEQLDLRIFFCSRSRKKSLPDCYSFFLNVTRFFFLWSSFSSVHLCLFVHVFVCVWNVFFAC